VATRISTYLHQAQDFSVVDGLLRHRTLEEIEGKRFAHKRAFLLDGVLVELFLIERDDRSLFTSFWAKSRHDWPADVLSSTSELPVASAAALTGYRARHSALRRDG